MAHAPSGTALLIIDPQRDFHEGGSLAVPGADADAERIAELIESQCEHIQHIVVTLDSHHPFDISLPAFWQNAEGHSPEPFTHISYEDVNSGKWVPVKRELLDHCKLYTKFLKLETRREHTIFPEHCLIGSVGHTVQPAINKALQEWGRTKHSNCKFVLKGISPLTEHFSAFKAEMPLSEDPSTLLNVSLISQLLSYSRVVVCGQAKSHCVAQSVRDLVAATPPQRHRDIVLLSDCMSSVTGFESDGESFLTDMQDTGCTVATAAEVSAILGSGS